MPDDWLDRYSFTGEPVWMPSEQYDTTLKQKLVELLKPMLPGVIMGFNVVDSRVWVQLSDPGDTTAWVNQALSALGRPALA